MRILSLLLGVLLLAGCNALRMPRSDNIEQPADLAKLEPSARVERLWKQSVGKGEGRTGLRQAPTVADGRLYTTTLKGDLHALSAVTGRELWRARTGLRLSGGPGVGEGTIVVGTLDGEVLALNPDTGSERWRARVSSEVVARPAVGRGVAVVRANDGRVFGFAITDGSRRWVYDRGLPSLTLRGNAAPVIGAGTVYVGYDSGDVVALSLEDGSLQWEQRIAEPEGRTELERMADVDGELVVTPGELYAASYKGQVVSLDPASGRALWNRDLVVFTGLALAGDRLLVTDRGGTVWALDRRSGAAAWRQDALAHRWLTTPAVQGSHVVVGDLEGYLHWLRLEDGQFAARERLGREPIRGTPQVADGVLYALGTGGELAAFRVSP
jgi:outer membrane protein assembly factor BamB